jgi:hypothetical protein
VIFSIVSKLVKKYTRKGSLKIIEQLTG